MEIAYISFFLLLALVLAISVVAYLSVALSSISSGLERFEYWLPTFLVLIAGVVMLAGGLFNSRNLQLASLGAGFIDTDSSPAHLWISRLASLLLLGLTIPYFIAKALENGKRNAKISLPFIIVVYFGASSFLLPGFLGLIPHFDHRPFYPMITMIAVYLASEVNPNGALRAVKWCVVAFLVESLAFIAVDSSRVLAPGYQGWVPGLSTRFWGLAPHANAIGPMASLVIFLEIVCPARHSLLRLGVFACGATVLVLAQSKTAIAATVAALVIVFYSRVAYRAKEKYRAGFYFHAGHLLLLACSIVGISVFLFLANMGMIDKFFNKLDSAGVTSSVQSMSGRTIIWEAAIREYKNNPLFGYGFTLWGDEYRRSIGLNYAYHAHNQILQTMAMAGTSGLVGLIAFIALATVRAIRAFKTTSGVSVALLMLLGFRLMTEVPLSPVGIANGEMMTIIALICIWPFAGDFTRVKQNDIHKNLCIPQSSR